jgi:hypothetical protein
MSKIALSGNASGTGTLTIAAPNTNSDATINLPTVTGGNFVVSNASGNVGIGTDSPLSTAMLEVSRSTTVIPTATVTADNQVVGWRSRRTGGSFPREYYIGLRENSTALDVYDNTADALRARIDSSGNLLVGTTVTPNVNPGILRVGGHINTLTGGVDSNPVISALFTYSGNTNEANAILTSVGGASDSGFYFDVSNGGGSTARTRTLRINRGSVTVIGSLSKSSGSFKIDHPLPEKSETHHLVHSFVEAPQADNIYRGKVELVNGRAEVNIDQAVRMTDGTFAALNRNVQCFTSNESEWDAVRASVTGNILTIECQNTNSTATISWMVIGERQDKHMYDTDWTDEDGKVIVEPLKSQTQKAQEQA